MHLKGEGIMPPRAAHWSAESLKQIIIVRMSPDRIARSTEGADGVASSRPCEGDRATGPKLISRSGPATDGLVTALDGKGV
jgi:hypothetical protein